MEDRLIKFIKDRVAQEQKEMRQREFQAAVQDILFAIIVALVFLTLLHSMIGAGK